MTKFQTIAVVVGPVNKLIWDGANRMQLLFASKKIGASVEQRYFRSYLTAWPPRLAGIEFKRDALTANTEKSAPNYLTSFEC